MNHMADRPLIVVDPLPHTLEQSRTGASSEAALASRLGGKPVWAT
jgi:hypothetical protein